MRERTLLVQRAIVLGGEDDTKTTQHRTVRLLAPLKLDLAEWLLASGSGVRLVATPRVQPCRRSGLSRQHDAVRTARRTSWEWSLPVSNR